MASVWLSCASRRFFKPSPFSLSICFSHSLFSISSSPYNEKSCSNPRLILIPNPFHSPLRSFEQYRGRKWIPGSTVGSLVHISTSSSASTAKSNGGCKDDDVSWIDLYFARQAQPYARLALLNKPIGTWLLAWPCMWSISLAADPGHLPDFNMLTLFGCGALFLRCAGCTINDLLDRDIDTMVERMKLRPVASGLLTPFKGLCFLGVQLLLGLRILIQLNN